MKLITGLLRFIFVVFGLGILLGIAVVLLIGGTLIALVRGGRRPQFQVYRQWKIDPFRADPFQDRPEKVATPIRERDVTPPIPHRLSEKGSDLSASP